MAGLKGLRRPEEVARTRGRTLEEVVSPVMLRRMEEAQTKSSRSAPAGAGGGGS